MAVNPLDGNLVVGGCANGQLSIHTDFLLQRIYERTVLLSFYIVRHWSYLSFFIVFLSSRIYDITLLNFIYVTTFYTNDRQFTRSTACRQIPQTFHTFVKISR